MNKFNVLYPIKNRQPHNLYNLLPHWQELDTILVLDSSDTAIDIIDLAGVFASVGVRLIYEYAPSMNLPQARAHLLRNTRAEYNLWLDSDVVLQRVHFGTARTLLNAGSAFVVPKVINSRRLHGKYKGNYEFLQQFADSPFDDSSTPFGVYPDCRLAGMYCMFFRFPEHPDFHPFVSAMSEVVPSEDLAFCAFMRLKTKNFGKIDLDSFVYHIGETNHAAWSFINYRRVEDRFLNIENLDQLAQVMGDLSRPEHISAIEHIYK